jgi:hypothetical protein
MASGACPRSARCDSGRLAVCGWQAYAGRFQFAQAVVPGSARIIASTGDDRNALIMLTVEADFGVGKVTLPGSRLYLLDDDSKIKSEHVVFYAAQTAAAGMRPGRRQAARADTG